MLLLTARECYEQWDLWRIQIVQRQVRSNVVQIQNYLSLVNVYNQNVCNFLFSFVLFCFLRIHLLCMVQNKGHIFSVSFFFILLHKKTLNNFQKKKKIIKRSIGTILMNEIKKNTILSTHSTRNVF